MYRLGGTSRFTAVVTCYLVGQNKHRSVRSLQEDMNYWSLNTDDKYSNSRPMRYFVSEVVRIFNIPWLITSRVYWEYLMEGTITGRVQLRGRPCVLSNRDQQCLRRIPDGNRQATSTKIPFAFNTGGMRRLSSRSVHPSLASMRRPIKVF